MMPTGRKFEKSTLHVTFLLHSLLTLKNRESVGRRSGVRSELEVYYCVTLPAYFKLLSSSSENRDRGGYLKGMYGDYMK